MLAALASASVVTLSKAAIKDVPPSLVLAIEAVLILAVAWGTVLVQDLLPEIGKIERKTWLVLVVAGVLTATSSLLVFWALSIGDASWVSPLTNISLVFSVTLAAIFLKGKADLAGATRRGADGGWSHSHRHHQTGRQEGRGQQHKWPPRQRNDHL